MKTTPESALAHVKPDSNNTWVTHALSSHLHQTATLAGQFASVFSGQDWAYLAGLWHDLGKYSDEFQRYIKTVSGYDAEAHIEGVNRVDHSTAGALYAMRQLGARGRILTYLIAGHHAGLPDWSMADTGATALLKPEQNYLLDRIFSPQLDGYSLTIQP